ncbi:MAG: hypothetical protein HY698_18435 [Deltaproteobacteria bacterium]|nr:hypothetical protein [Deltaproteobacteria bacterium]
MPESFARWGQRLALLARVRYKRAVRREHPNVFLVVALSALVGCAGARVSRPTSAIDAYVSALEASDFARAYALMSSSYKRDHSREDFIRMMKENPAEVRESIARLRAGRRETEVTARLVYGELRDELHLIHEESAWRITDDPLSFYRQDTPALALRSFLRALSLKRYDVVLRFIPDEYRKHMTAEEVRVEFEGERKEENATMLRLLMANLESPIEQQGDTARMPFSDRYEVKFKRENGEWKIEDLY